MHYPLWDPPPPSTVSREFPPCVYSTFKVYYAIHSKYPFLLLYLSNWQLSPLKLPARNLFPFWCSLNPCCGSLCYQSFLWLLGVLLIPYYSHCSFLQLCFELLLLLQRSLRILNKSIILLYNLLVFYLQIKKPKQNICHMYIVLCCLFKHSSSSYVLI